MRKSLTLATAALTLFSVAGLTAPASAFAADTPSPSASATPSDSPTPSAPVTPSDPPTPSVSPSPSASATPSSSPTPTPTPTGSLPATAPDAPLNKNLVPTPPMGFNDWNSFGCNVSEQLIEQTADYFVSSGLKAAGYQYVNIDDCWLTKTRDPETGRLVPDPVKFPDGIAGTAAYVHSKGLKLGIYEDAGLTTCAGYPGSLGHEVLDAQTFADWGVDYLKYDNCDNNGSSTQADYIARYTAMRNALALTGRPIVYSLCEWGGYEPWTWSPPVGHLWRTTGDIADNWPSLKSIIAQNSALAAYAGPGGFNDPDMLEVGNGGMTDTEYRTHFGLWSMMAAPLLIGSDLRKASAETLKILTNKELIAIDQDPLGLQAKVVSDVDGLQTFAKPLKNGDVAVALYNSTDTAAPISVTAKAAGLPSAKTYVARDVWSGTSYETSGVIGTTVPAHGTVIYRVLKDGSSWNDDQPLTGVSIGLPGAGSVGSQLLLKPGAATPVTTALLSHGRHHVRTASVRLTAPDGWTVTAASSPTDHVVDADKPFTTKWKVTAPADLQPGTYQLGVSADYSWASGQYATTTSSLTVLVAVAPAAGTHDVSDLSWVSSTNAWGPVEINTSNGEQAAGDGLPITINGVVYAKGLGTNAPSEVDYYIGGTCTTVSTDVGIDDEKSASDANATFEIYADGKLAATSTALTDADPAQHLTADVTGATLLRLVVDDDGNADSDHADWAAPTLTCS